MNKDRLNEIRQDAIEKLQDSISPDSVYGCDLHNELFNTDYYIIGRYQATQWIGEDVFDIIGEIKEYEEDNFGQVSADLSEPEHVVNMYVYILGEQVLQESETLNRAYDDKLTQKDIEDIIKELKENLK